MRFDFTFGPDRSRAPRRRDAGTPARILLLADLQGHAKAPAGVLDRTIVRVDVDNVDALLARYAPEVVLGAAAGGERLKFQEFGDFHPDALVGSLSVFQRLVDARHRVEHAATYADAVAALWPESPVPRAIAPEGEPLPPAGEDAGSTFERLLGHRTRPAAEDPSKAASAADRLIRSIVAPYVVAARDPQLPQLLSAVDVALSDVMRRVLHDPGFQAVEATWRSIQWLVSTIELGEDLELYLLHVAREELPLEAASQSPVYRRLADRETRTAGGLDLAAVIGDYRFDATPGDLAVLESMGELARALGAPFVAGCAAGLLGTGSVAQQPDPAGWSPLDPDVDMRWNALRAGATARYLGLALPRVLLRLPYGRKSDPITRFEFEEMPPVPDHESFLWGNAAMACATVIARGLQPGAASGDPGDIADLPAFVFTVDDEPRLQPCAEVCLSEHAVEAILARGVMPLVSFKDRNAVRLIRLQSIADPPNALIA